MPVLVFVTPDLVWLPRAESECIRLPELVSLPAAPLRMLLRPVSAGVARVPVSVDIPFIPVSADMPLVPDIPLVSLIAPVSAPVPAAPVSLLVRPPLQPASATPTRQAIACEVALIWCTSPSPVLGFPAPPVAHAKGWHGGRR